MLIEDFATNSYSSAKSRNDSVREQARLSSARGVFVAKNRRFLFSPASHPSADRRFASPSPLSPLHSRPLSRTDNDVHYFLLLQRARGNGRSRGGCRGGCSLAPRRIIRCRYAITTFASTEWKRFRFFAPAPDGR